MKGFELICQVPEGEVITYIDDVPRGLVIYCASQRLFFFDKQEDVVKEAHTKSFYLIN